MSLCSPKLLDNLLGLMFYSALFFIFALQVLLWISVKFYSYFTIDFIIFYQFFRVVNAYQCSMTMGFISRTSILPKKFAISWSLALECFFSDFRKRLFKIFLQEIKAGSLSQIQGLSVYLSVW